MYPFRLRFFQLESTYMLDDILGDPSSHESPTFKYILHVLKKPKWFFLFNVLERPCGTKGVVVARKDHLRWKHMEEFRHEHNGMGALGFLHRRRIVAFNISLYSLIGDSGKSQNKLYS